MTPTKLQKATLENIQAKVQSILDSNCSLITKVEAKCWEYHSKSRVNNGNDPFKFENYTHMLGHHVPLDYIKYNLIDVSDLGNEAEVTHKIRRYYNL